MPAPLKGAKAGVIAERAPVVGSMVYWFTTPLPSDTYRNLPEGWMAMNWGLLPVIATAPGDMGVSVPSAPMVYWATERSCVPPNG